MWFIQPTQLCVAHSELQKFFFFLPFTCGVVSLGWDVAGGRVVDEVSERGGVIGDEGSHSLVEKAVEQSYRASSDVPVRPPDDRAGRGLERWVVSFTLLLALLQHNARKMSSMEGRGAPMMFTAVFTVGSSGQQHCSSHTRVWSAHSQWSLKKS